MKRSRKFSLEKKEFRKVTIAVWNYLKSFNTELGLFCVSQENKGRALSGATEKQFIPKWNRQLQKQWVPHTRGIQVENTWSLDYTVKRMKILDDSVLSTLWFCLWQLKIFLSKIDFTGARNPWPSLCVSILIFFII